MYPSSDMLGPNTSVKDHSKMFSLSKDVYEYGSFEYTCITFCFESMNLYRLDKPQALMYRE